MQAIELLYGNTPEENRAGIAIFITGGRDKSGASRALEATARLAVHHELPKTALRPLPSAGNTMGNAEAIAAYLDKEESDAERPPVEILTNDYHALRSWIMFSGAMLERSAGKPLAEAVSEEDKAAIGSILESYSPEREDWSPEKVKEARDAVMGVLNKYFEGSKNKVVPIAAEDVLAADTDPVNQRYARLLRVDSRARKMLAAEYQGIRDLLAGKYKIT